KTFVNYEFKSRSNNNIKGMFLILAYPLFTFMAHLFFASAISSHAQSAVDIMSILCCSMAWYYFSQTIVMTTNIFIYRSEFVKTTNFDKNIFTKSILLSNIIIGLMAFIIVYYYFVLRGFSYGENFIVSLFVLGHLNLIVFTYDCAVILSHLNAIFRDLSHVASFLLQVIFFTSPIHYRKTIENEWFQLFQTINPFAYHFKLFHYAAGEPLVSLTDTVLPAIVATLITLILAKIVQLKLSKKIYFYV